MSKQTLKPEMATAPQLRAWLVLALSATKLKPATVSLSVGPSVNLVGTFLRDINRDITLTRASNIECVIRRKAAEMCIKLQKISDVEGLAQGAGDV